MLKFAPKRLLRLCFGAEITFVRADEKQLFAARPTKDPMASKNHAQGAVILERNQDPRAQGRVAHFDEDSKIASTRGVRYELSTAARLWTCESWARTDESIVAAIKLWRKKS